MSVWLTIPSARPPEEAERVLKLWRRQGYKIALWRDTVKDSPVAESGIWADVYPRYAQACNIWTDIYPGYAQACNELIKLVMKIDPQAEWFVCAGDDTEPDLAHSAEQIAAQCLNHFTAERMKREIEEVDFTTLPSVQRPQSTFGVMQPTGDRFADGSIDRICGSPWIGREFARRMYGGNGPYWPEYRHMFVDEELQEVALKMGILWQRRDLIHLHRHFQRESDALNSNAGMRPMPAHLVESNSPEHWAKYSKIFKDRKANGFPGHEPI